MKAYGVPRVPEIVNPDLADIYRFGFKSSISRCKKKNGDIPNSFHNSKSKAQSRRTWARKARAEGKVACRNNEE